MDHALNGPWWAWMAEAGSRPHRPEHEGHGRRRGRPGSRDGGPDSDPEGMFGPRGPFGPHGPFGPGPRRGPGGPGRRGPRARRGDVRQAILALLAEEPLNGYQLIQAIEERTGGNWKPSPGAVYPALAQLADEGLVSQVSEGGRPAFQLTEAGRAAASALPGQPWSTPGDGSGAPEDHGAAGLWRDLGRVALAARSVLAAGDPALVARATEVLAEARRRLHSLLAEGPGPG